ncbi:glycosyltransferase family 4 protein [Gammaproteobacteria bacterium]|nr:glycosyltransferase family 4 protein [Gammaproteobacteria bacterium]
MSSERRVLQVCSSHQGLRGGAEQFCLSLSEQLYKTGNHLLIATGDVAQDEEITIPSDFVILPQSRSVWPRKLLFDYINPPAVNTFRHLLRRFSPDIVHFHSFYGLSTYLVKVATAHCPVVITLHDAWPAFTDANPRQPKLGLANTYLKVPHGFLHRQINRHFLNNAALVSPSRWLVDFFDAANFTRPLHIPNGIIDIGEITKYDNTILWVGSLTSFKGLSEIISTVDFVASQFGWRFIVIGEGPEKERLSTLYPNIKFLGYQNPTPYFELASVLIVSSVGWENFPTVILEAMRHGLCIVGRDLGGTAELIRINNAGVLYMDTASLKNSLLSLILNKPRIREFGENGRRQYCKQYRLDICAERYVSLYRSLTN